MACLQNGTTLLNNNNLSSFKHNIMKYNEAHSNMWSNSAQINNFLSNQIPFRNNHTKDKIQSDNKIINNNNENDNETSEIESKIYEKVNDEDNEATTTQENEKLKEIKTNKNFHFFQSTITDSTTKKPEETGWLNNKRNLNSSHIYDVNDTLQNKREMEQMQVEKLTTINEIEITEPSHHARRPMNAFLIFCKRHRTIVKNRYPHLENRAVTKILGEWWAGLEPDEKACYTELAKQYKNAFFSANPNFKWYKLPAPPLRTLNTRPGNIVKSPPPQKQLPDNKEQQQQPQQLFTPGKLADETQLGSITSLINCNIQHSTNNNNSVSIKNNITEKEEEYEQESPKYDYKQYLYSPPTNMMICQPAKPFKKRVIQESTTDNKNNVVRSIFSSDDGENNKTAIFDSNLLNKALENFVDTVGNESYDSYNYDYNIDQQSLNNNSNLTQQELINKVVDHMCSSKTESNDSSNTDEIDDSDCNACLLQNQDDDRSVETRKSVRSCKGLRYAKFMLEGNYLSKRGKKYHHSQLNKVPKSLCTSSNVVTDKVPRISESIELSDTIKKLAERTIGSNAKTTIPYTCMDQEVSELIDKETYGDESREETIQKMFRAADFNLDEKIEALPSLSLDKFQQKKKENKKRKFLRATRSKETTTKKVSTSNARSECDNNRNNNNNVNLIGSRKRKPRKQSITRLDLPNDNNNKTEASSSDLDLFGLATLAEVAAKKAKIDQK